MPACYMCTHSAPAPRAQHTQCQHTAQRWGSQSTAPSGSEGQRESCRAWEPAAPGRTRSSHPSITAPIRKPKVKEEMAERGQEAPELSSCSRSLRRMDARSFFFFLICKPYGSNNGHAGTARFADNWYVLISASVSPAPGRAAPNHRPQPARGDGPRPARPRYRRDGPSERRPAQRSSRRGGSRDRCRSPAPPESQAAGASRTERPREAPLRRQQVSVGVTRSKRHRRPSAERTGPGGIARDRSRTAARRLPLLSLFPPLTAEPRSQVRELARHRPAAPPAPPRAPPRIPRTRPGPAAAS